MALQQYYLFYLAQKLAAAINDHVFDADPTFLNKLYQIWMSFGTSQMSDRIYLRDDSPQTIEFIERLPDYRPIFEVDEKEGPLLDRAAFFDAIPLARIEDETFDSIIANRNFFAGTNAQVRERVVTFNDVGQRRGLIRAFLANPEHLQNQLNIVFRVLPYAREDDEFINEYIELGSVHSPADSDAESYQEEFGESDQE